MDFMNLVVFVNGWPVINAENIKTKEAQIWAIGFMQGQKQLCFCIDQDQVPAQYIQSLEQDIEKIEALKF